MGISYGIGNLGGTVLGPAGLAVIQATHRLVVFDGAPATGLLLPTARMIDIVP